MESIPEGPSNYPIIVYLPKTCTISTLYPKPKDLIIGYLDPLGMPRSTWLQCHKFGHNTLSTSSME